MMAENNKTIRRAKSLVFFGCAIFVFQLGIPLTTKAEENTTKQTQTNSAEVKPDAGNTDKADATGDDQEISIADQAFSAYQRGEYLTAFSLGLEGAQKGDPAAQTLIGELYDRGLGVARNENEAAQWYGIAAKAGNREAQFAYAVKLMQGKGVEQDKDAGIEMMKLAADKGHRLAEFNYAQYVMSIEPGNAGTAKAVPYLEKAANNGVPEAAYQLAQLDLNGYGDVLPNPKSAFQWMEKASVGGMGIAKVELAIWLLNGTVGPADVKRGMELMESAASRGNVIAQNRLAHLYVKGIGGEKDDAKAAYWYLLSAKAGRSDVDLADFFSRLPEEVRKSAERLAAKDFRK